MIIIRVNFEEKIYTGVDVLTDNCHTDKSFSSNDVVRDWFMAIRYSILTLKSTGLLYSKSLDEFLELNPEYELLYGTFAEGEFKLIYPLEDEVISHLKFIAEKNTPLNWEDFKIKKK